jgi:hypothetical protein
MSLALGPFKVLEKIDDNAYKLELHINFGVSHMFISSDLHPYFGEEDLMPSRTTLIQDDEDITTHDTSPSVLQGPITRASVCVGHSFPNVVNQEQCNTIISC